MGDVLMEIIIALIVGVLTVLTVENTILLHRKQKVEQKEPTREEQRKAEEEKRDAENWQRVMDFHGSIKG